MRALAMLVVSVAVACSESESDSDSSEGSSGESDETTETGGPDPLACWQPIGEASAHEVFGLSTSELLIASSDGVLVVGVGERDAHAERDAQHHAVRERRGPDAIPAPAHEVELAVDDLGPVGDEEVVDLRPAGERRLRRLEDPGQLVGGHVGGGWRIRWCFPHVAVLSPLVRVAHSRGSSSPSEKGG